MKEYVLKFLALTFDITHNIGGVGIFTSVILWIFKYGPNILERWFNVSLKFIDVLERIHDYKAKLKTQNNEG